jgi:methionyl-tRNA formyltransferase
VKEPRIIFWGSPDFSLSALEACKKFGKILGVVTQPDKERGRGHDVLPTPVKAWAIKEGRPVFSPKSLRKLDDEGQRLMDFLAKEKADFFVVVAYGNLLPDAVLAMPLKAPVNVHASLLPRWRGAAPIQRALEAGDQETGVSLQRMVKELDAGDVYLERKYKIVDEDNSATLFTKLSELGGELIADFLQKDFSSLTPQKQDPEKITLAAKIDKKEALWRKEWSAADFHNKVRAFIAWPTVKINFTAPKSNVEIKILKTKKVALTESSSWGVKDNIAFVKGNDNKFTQILLAQSPGKGPTDAAQIFTRLKSEGFEV